MKASQSCPAVMITSPASSTGRAPNLVSSRRVTSVDMSTTVSVDGSRPRPVCTGLKWWTFCR